MTIIPILLAGYGWFRGIPDGEVNNAEAIARAMDGERITARTEDGSEVCGEVHKKGHVVESTTLDAVAQTQRVSYKTADLYKTMVLSKTISGTTATEKPTTDNNPSTGTANPSTGANDIVSVAVVFAVISLASAGAFLTLRAKSHK